MVGGNSAILAVGGGIAGVADLADARGEILAVPGISRSPVSSSVDSSCGWFETMSAPLR
jgi:hypothetical protein